MAVQDVTLTWPEYKKAAAVGFSRHYRATSKGLRGNRHYAWTSDIEGACAEAAVNKFLFGKPVPAVDSSWSGPDLPGNVEVKSFYRDRGGALTLKTLKRVEDAERNYIFVERLPLKAAGLPTYRVHGYLTGESVQDLSEGDHYALRNAVDQGNLGDPEHLKDEVNTFVPDELRHLSPAEATAYMVELGDPDGYDRRFNEQLDAWLAERGESS
jgi:hypothetical protein